MPQRTPTSIVTLALAVSSLALNCSLASDLPQGQPAQGDEVDGGGEDASDGRDVGEDAAGNNDSNDGGGDDDVSDVSDASDDGGGGDVAVDECPGSDKVTPGVCGCDVADTDSDDDGAPDCVDTCPTDPEVQDGVCRTCWGALSNVSGLDEDASRFTAAVDLGCDVTLDTSTLGETLADWCGPMPAVTVLDPVGDAPGAVLLTMASFRLQAGFTLRLIGDKPVIFAVRGPVAIEGTIDAGARGRVPGAGGDVPTDGPIATAGVNPGADCAVQPEGTGRGMEGGRVALGGGGAGFRTNGGFGGGERGQFRCYKQADGYECKPACPDTNCDNSFADWRDRHVANNSQHYGVAPVRGVAALDQSLRPLRGGCAGGKGDSRDEGRNFFGGAGGGSFQIVSTDTLTLSAGATLSAAGGGGINPDDHAGGSGGGSGGGILLEAVAVAIDPGAALRAHGGSGAGRSCTGQPNAQDGHLADDSPAMHQGCPSHGRGGLSYWDTNNAMCNGAQGTLGDPSFCTLPPLDWPGGSLAAYPQAGNFSDNNGGGGGGGSGGVIVVRTLPLAGFCP